MLTVFLVIALVGGAYMAWNIGANDVANAFGTSVGSGALTIRRAVVLAAVCEFCGAFFVGAPVAQTISGRIVRPDIFAADPEALGIGMVAALLGAAIWLNVATFLSQPVSTTHAIIGAVIGFAIVATGARSVEWHRMATIAASWVVSPLAGGILAYVVYRWGIRKYVLDSRHQIFMAMATLPIAVGVLVAVVTFSIVYKGLPKLHLDLPLVQSIPLSILAGAAVATALRLALRRRMWRHRVRLADRSHQVERWFGYMQILTACYMSFAHGANDVANAVGPLAAAVQILRRPHELPGSITVPPWLLAAGGVFIVVGLATYGYKVIEAIGRKITEITPTRGVAAELGTATTVLVFSKLGMPISTTFVIVGAVMGVGLARGFAAIDLKVIRKIFTSWVVTIPASAVLTAVIYYLLMSFR